MVITGASGGTNAATVLRCTTGSQPGVDGLSDDVARARDVLLEHGHLPAAGDADGGGGVDGAVAAVERRRDRRCVEDVALPQLDVAVGEAALAEHPTRLLRVAHEGHDLVAGGQ